MILAKGWFKRLLARRAEECVVVLDFYALDLEAICEHGTYLVRRCGADWEARFRAKDARADARELPIDARHVDGGPIDWPSRGCAEWACRLHAHLLELGYPVARATELVAQRSQRVAEHQREPTLEYAAVRT